MTQVGQMNSYLVGPTAFQVKLHQLAALVAMHYPVMGAGRPTAGYHRHSLAIS